MPEERSLADKLLDLYAKRDEAVMEGDLERVHDLQAEITETAAQQQKGHGSS
jgi:hypothetical protein